jgi:hypothetical protein
MGRSADLERLFLRWRAHWLENRVPDKFVPDGIGDEVAWAASAPRVLWVLREPNDASPRSNEWDLRDFLRSPAWEWTDQDRPGNLWPMIARCSYGIIHHPCTFRDADERYRTSGILRRIAAMNIKKSPGVDTVVWSELRRFAKLDAPFIREEIEIIDPTIIVCGGTLGFVCNALGVAYGEDDERAPWNGKVIVGWGHPGARTSKQEYYEHVMRLAFG